MKLTAIEKRVLILTTIVIGIFATSILIIGNRNLWFENKNNYKTTVNSADGLTKGSKVTFAGLRVGEVTHLSVNENNKIEVQFTVSSSLAEKIKNDSVARLIRAMSIGEMRIEIQPGTQSSPVVKPGNFIEGRDSMEITDIISGKNIGVFLERIEGVTKGIGKWGEAMAILTKKFKPEDLAKTYELIYPTMKNIGQLTKDLKVFTDVLHQMKSDLFDNKLAKKSLRNIEQITKPLAKQKEHIEGLLINVNTLTAGLAENPKFSQNIAEALQEVILTLKAMQKSWFLEKHVKELKNKQLEP
ncbi:MAG: MCE family protein [Halobacteriovoraceae bacterium]|jgi:phospholipid/cholesterol/gamma-HCH transport system substrate-binding protein|nr:MCE family protein [Halobacteriovoraceae bacterium]MBT5092678.1 MCE family protein [Halobacteriovoraceae bacterium]